MGGGWVIGIAKKGTNPELAGDGRVEWVAAGAVQVKVTSWGVKASSYLAESGGMEREMRALTQASMDFSNDIMARRPNIAQFCDSQSLVESIEGRMQDCKLARNSATRVWWTQISAMLRWWRRGGEQNGISNGGGAILSVGCQRAKTGPRRTGATSWRTWWRAVGGRPGRSLGWKTPPGQRRSNTWREVDLPT